MNAFPEQSGRWKPTATDKGRLWLGIAACFFVLAAQAYLSPSSSSFHGRLGWLHRAFFDAFGASGDIVLNCVIGGILLVVGFLYLSKKEA
jgi:hypothetical protein